MKKLLLFVFFLANVAVCMGQINMEDSTVQVVGYWDRNEKQSYTVSHEEYKVSKGDTTSRVLYTYDVDITIIDSTAKSYTIQWDYSNFNVVSELAFMKKLIEATKLNKAIIKTNELGVFEELVNWKDVRKETMRLFKVMQKEFKQIPNFDSLLKQQMALFQSKASIEAALIEEIQQFYTFHGGAYKYGEDIESTIQMPNRYGGKPFDAEVVIWVDTLNATDSYSTICMTNTVDSVQLWNAAYEYLTKMASTMSIPLPKKEDFPSFKNITYTTAQIHNYGWIISSIVTKEIEADNMLKVEEQIIEIK